MRTKNEKSIYWKYTFYICVSLAAGLTIILVAIYFNIENLISHQPLKEARLLFHAVSLDKKWNSRFGGVFVLKRPGMESNPYLVTPDIVTADGKVYTEKNPALMTREISRLAEQEGYFTYHLAGTNFMHPDSKPDSFEAASLARFDSGEKEHYITEQRNGRTFFRYMAPLCLESSCMICHAPWGDREGDIFGGISIGFEIDDLKRLKRLNQVLILSTGLLGLAILSSGIALVARKLFRTISEERKTIETIAMTDELTGLYNRRHILARFNEEIERARRVRSRLCCILGDIDHFKSINDKFGHLAGDTVLKEAALIIRQALRPYDLVGRFGGEEFLMVLPDTGIEDTVKLAERLGKAVQEQLASNAHVPGGRIVTISLGVTCFYETDGTVDDVIRRADENLYRAKAKGRDRVEGEMA